MKRKILAIALIGALLTAGLVLIACGTMGGRGGARSTGTFTGTAMGYGGTMVVEVAVDRGRILDINVVSHGETYYFFQLPLERVISSVINERSLNVDNVAGATLSTMALRMAITEALDKAGFDTAAMMRVPRPRHTPQNLTKTADIIIVGSGGAGLTAMAQAAQLGASVILIESMEILGGNTAVAGGGLNVSGTLNQISTFGSNADNAEWHARQTWDWGDRVGNMQLIRTMTYNALDTVNWMRDYFGVRWSPDPAGTGGGLARSRLLMAALSPAEPMGTMWINAFLRFAEQPGSNIEILMGTRGTELITRGGRVVGVRAENLKGDTLTLNATRGVVLATGGFGANVEMRQRYDELWRTRTPAIHLDRSVLTTNVAGAQGSGIYMAKDVGAALVDMGYIQLIAFGNPKTGGVAHPFIFPAMRLWINMDGERFTDENGRRDDMTIAVFAQRNATMYLVMDGTHFNAADAAMQAEVLRLPLIKGNTLEEVAAQIDGMDADRLRATLTRYNKQREERGVCAITGRDFAQMPGDEFHFDRPPFLFFTRVPSVHHTMGGVKIDRHTRVIHTNGNPIPGLYAAGEVTGGIHGRNRIGGNAITDIFVFGRIAGKNAFLGEDPITGQNAAFFNAIPCVCENLLPLPTGVGTGIEGFDPRIFQSIPDHIIPVCCP